MKKTLSLLLAFTLAFAMNTAVFAETEISNVSLETTYIDEQVLMEPFTNFTITNIAGASISEDPLAPNNKILKLESSGRGGNLNIPVEIPGDADYTISMKIYAPLQSTVQNRMFYLQMIYSGGAAPQLQFWETSDQSTGYRFLDGTSGVGGNIVPSGLFSGDGYTEFSFSVNKTTGTVTYNIDGETYTQTYTEEKKSQLLNDITNIRLYAYNSGIQPVCIDDVTVVCKKRVEYDPSALTQSFDAQMDYTNPTPQIKITNGIVSKWLAQEIKLVLIDEQNSITEVETIVAEKAQTDESGTFEFLSDLPQNFTPGYYYVNIAQFIDGTKKHDSQKLLYIATAEQLAALPGDFANLPEDEVAAKEMIASYLPCFLTDEAQNELFPKENGTYTPQGEKNLTFIAKYFKNCEKTYNSINDVQMEFEKAKGYLNLKNAQTVSETKILLTNGGYLEEYLENEVFIENEESFFAHFDTKRNNEENPLVSDAAIESAVRYAFALTALNVAERSEIQTLVETYNDIYSIDLTREGIDEVEKDALYSALYNKNYTSVSSIDSDFAAKLTELLAQKDEVAEEDKEENSTSSSVNKKPSAGGGGGGGGGTGGGKNTVVKTDVPLEQPAIEPEKPQISMFNDTEGHWAEAEIELLCKNGIITGFEDGSFKPENTLTRAQTVAMLTRILPDEVVGDNPFTDVRENDWYFEAAKKAAAKGIVKGTDGKFLPNEPISREQLLVMIYRALNLASTDSVAEAIFADNEDISAYAIEAIAYFAEKGIISGYPDNTIRPKNTASRAEAAKLLCAAFSNIIE